MESVREAVSYGLRTVPYLEPEGDWDSAMTQIGEVLGRAAPNARGDDRTRAVEFTYLAAAGRTGESRLPDLDMYPSPQFVSDLLWALTDRPEEYLGLPRALIVDIDPLIRSELARYFNEVERAIRANRCRSTLDQATWNEISQLDIMHMVHAYGVPGEALQRLPGARRAIVHGFQQLLEFTYGYLPLVSVCLRWLSQRGLATLGQHRAWTLGILHLMKIHRVAQYLKAASLPDALPDFDRSRIMPRDDRADRVYIPRSPVTPALLQAIWSGGRNARFKQGGWRLKRDDRFHGETAGSADPAFPSSAGIELRLECDILEADVLQWDAAAPGQAVFDRFQVVEGFSPFTADVALAVLAEMICPTHGTQPQFPLLQPVEISAEAILAYKRFRTGGAMGGAMRARLVDEMERLASLRIKREGGELPATRSVRGAQGSDDSELERLFHITRLEYPVECAPQGRHRAGQCVLREAWLVRAGAWARELFSAGAGNSVAAMARLLLEMDHREVRGSVLLAKKLGQWITLSAFHSRGIKRTQTFVIGNLLQAIGELPVQCGRSRNWAGRVRERFDSAMLALRDGGILAQVTWPGGHGPGDPDRAKGWVNRWLAATVRVTLPVLPKEPAPDKPPVQGGEDFSLPVGKRLGEHLGERFGERLGERLRRTRIHRGFSQAAVAATLQISRGYLSQLENGLRRPSPALHQRILRWLRDTRDTHGSWK